MIESKIALTERLRKENRWAEASKFKDDTIKQLRGDGMTKAAAADEAWERMEKAFPPLPVPEGQKPSEAAMEAISGGDSGQNGQDDDLLDIDAMIAKQPHDFARDVRWTKAVITVFRALYITTARQKPNKAAGG
jgi:hypothetical protein